jgi:hypothetical protein
MRLKSLKVGTRSRICGVPCKAPQSGALPHLAGRCGVRTNLRAKHAHPNPAAAPERRQWGCAGATGREGRTAARVGRHETTGTRRWDRAGAAVAIGTDGEGGKAAVWAWRGRWVWERAASRA